MKDTMVWLGVLVVATACARADLRDGLIAYWPFEDGQGLTATDITGNGFDGALSPADIAWVPGKVGTAVDCDGTNGGGGLPYDDGTGYVHIGQDDALKPPQISVQAWINLDTFVDWGGLVGNVYDTGATESGWALHTRSDGVVAFYVSVLSGGDATLQTVSHGNTPTGQWIHCVGTYDGSEVKLYVNGAGPIVTSTSGGPIDYSTEAEPIAMRIGQYFDDNEENRCDGRIDEVAIWDRALSPDEVAELYNNGMGRPLPPLTRAVLPKPNTDFVPVDTDLEWAAPLNADVVAYDVWFGTDTNQVSPTYDFTKIVDHENVTSVDPAPGGDLDSDTRYYWRVDIYEPNGPSEIFHEGVIWTFQTAPEIPVVLADPEGVVVGAGETAQMTVIASNATTYTWFRSIDAANDTAADDVQVASGQDLSTLTLTDVQEADEGYYYCVVSNSIGEQDVSGVALLMTQRLIHHWTLDGNADDVVVDFDGPMNGTVVGDPNWVEGIDGQAISLFPATVFGSAEDDWVVLGDVQYGTGDFSVSFWMKTDALDSDPALISNKDWDSGSNVGWVIAWGGAGDGIYQWNLDTAGAGRNDFDPTGPETADSQWHLVTVTHDRDGMAVFYIDGNFRGQVDISAHAHATLDAGLPTVLGNDGKQDYHVKYPGARVKAAIDDVRLWNYALDATEVAWLYVNFVEGEVRYPYTTQPAFDLNDDWKVDLADLALLASEWLECGRIPPEACLTP